MELLYRQGRPEALTAAKSLPKNAESVALKARIYDEIANPPMTQEALEFLTQAKKLYKYDLPIRELYVELLKRKRSFLKVPIEIMKLESLRKRIQREKDAIFRVEEITFENEKPEKPEETAAPENDGE